MQEVEPAPIGPDHKWEGSLLAFIEVAQAHFKRKGRNEKQAFSDAHDVITEIAHYMGGRIFYLPRGDSLKRAIRDSKIAARIGKETIEDLAAEFRLTPSTIYRIVKTQQAIHRAKRNAESAQ